MSPAARGWLSVLGRFSLLSDVLRADCSGWHGMPFAVSYVGWRHAVLRSDMIGAVEEAEAVGSRHHRPRTGAGGEIHGVACQSWRNAVAATRPRGILVPSRPCTNPHRAIGPSTDRLLELGAASVHARASRVPSARQKRNWFVFGA